MISSFGVFMVLAFVAAYITFRSEYRRKEADGLIYAFHKKLPATSPLLTACLITFISSKIVYWWLHRTAYIGTPQDFIFSIRGSWLPGLLIGTAAWYLAKRSTADTQITPDAPITPNAPFPTDAPPTPAPPIRPAADGSRSKTAAPIQHPHELMDTLLVYCGLSGFAGAILFAFFENPQHIGFNGLNFYGALIAGTLTYLFINKRYGIRPAIAVDIGSPGMMLAYAVGRIGCHIAGDGDWGIVNTHPKPGWLQWLPDWAWAWNYPHNTIHQGVYLPGCTGGNCNVLPDPVYPTPLYEALICGLMFILIWAVRRRPLFRRPGALFSLYAILNGLERFFIEFIRVTPKYDLGILHLSQAQLISLGWILTGILTISLTKPSRRASLLLIILLLPGTHLSAQKIKAKPQQSAFNPKPNQNAFNPKPKQSTSNPEPQQNAINQTRGIRKDTNITAFFNRDTGWIASDGGFSIPLKDGRVLWTMGDSYIDHLNQKTHRLPCLFQERNSMLIQPKGNWDWHATTTRPGLFKNNPDENHLLWPNAGYQQGDTVYVYCSHIMNATGGLGFARGGNDCMAKLLLPDLHKITYDPLQSFDSATFGLGFDTEESDGYIYTWGYKPAYITSRIVVARFPKDYPRAPWSFWNGKTWDTTQANMQPIATGACNSMYVAKVRNKYVLLSTELSIACDQGTRIYVSSSDHVTGPFTSPRVLYTIPDRASGHSPFFYAPILHPEYIDTKDEILITYDINGYAPCLPICPDGFNPDYYRPRGLRVPIKMLD